MVTNYNLYALGSQTPAGKSQKDSSGTKSKSLVWVFFRDGYRSFGTGCETECEENSDSMLPVRRCSKRANGAKKLG